jgi:hypothetical protein
MPVEKTMNFLKKATVAFAAASMVAAPVAASAAQPRFDDLRVSTEMQDSAALGEDGAAGESWVLLLLAAAAIIGGIVIAAGGSSSSPTSP